MASSVWRVEREQEDDGDWLDIHGSDLVRSDFRLRMNLFRIKNGKNNKRFIIDIKKRSWFISSQKLIIIKYTHNRYNKRSEINLWVERCGINLLWLYFIITISFQSQINFDFLLYSLLLLLSFLVRNKFICNRTRPKWNPALADRPMRLPVAKVRNGAPIEDPADASPNPRLDL